LLRLPSRTARFHKRDRGDDQRSAFERDRDRVLYASSLRRLAGVTQVVSAAEGSVFHNRLTHSLQVAQIARRLAQRLVKDHPSLSARLGGLDPDVAETAALCHDLGHPPFGHVAEEELDRLVVAAGDSDGFEGNAQSLRIVTKLSVRHKDFPGLNLTRASLNAILKYPWFRMGTGKRHRKWGAYRTERREFLWARRGLRPQARTLEAQVMDAADDIAFSVHDVEDFFRAGLIPLDRLLSDRGGVQLDRLAEAVFQRRRTDKRPLTVGGRRISQSTFRSSLERLLSWFPLTEPFRGSRNERALLRAFTSTLISNYIQDHRLERPTGAGDALVLRRDYEIEIVVLKELVFHYVIHNPALATQQLGHKAAVRHLFSEFLHGTTHNADLLPSHCRDDLTMIERLPSRDRRRARARLVADTIASMSERQIVLLHNRLRGIDPGSIFDLIGR